MRWPLLVLLPAFATTVAGDGGGEGSEEKRCDTLKTALRYAQDKAPRDISAVLPVIVEKVNRELSGVVDVEVGWTGGESFRSRVGDHAVRCSVTRLVSALGPDATDSIHENDETGVDEEGRRTVTQCFDVPFRILDTDECSLPSDHPMRHQCATPSKCVNTIGSYECICGAVSGLAFPSLEEGKAADDAYFSELEAERTGDLWSTSLNSTVASSCPGRASTNGCCDASGHSFEGAQCRASFHCAEDPCATGGKGNDCASSARCVRSASPLDRPDHQCRCPQGLMGSGRRCKKGIDPKPRPAVEFDGVTPTEETVRNGYYCGCTKPVVDACAGFPPCEGKHEICSVTASNTPVCTCKPGYVRVSGYGCVDESPPVLRLRNDPSGDGINKLKQGDVYHEFAVEIVDENAEEYLRSLKIAYSRPLPPGCLTKTGRFHVNYTVATPWTSPPFVRVTRTVIIEDVDECSLDVDKYESQCPELIPQCDTQAGALCVNTRGSYTCKCPEYTSGDGFQVIEDAQKDDRGRFVGTPEGYAGGTGCRDTSKPVTELLGPNPKIFRVCKCGGLNGIIGSPGSDDEEQKLCDDQRSWYGRDVRSLIDSTGGAELCATHTRRNPSPKDCVRASDHTYRGIVDLTSRVQIGEPVQKSELRWSVPYDVVDDAGNKAKTVWREVVVEEVELADLERRIRNEVLADLEKETKEAVAAAIEEERKKNEKKSGAKKVKDACPACPKCECPDASTVGLSEDQCDAKCDERIATESRSCAVSTSAAAKDQSGHERTSIPTDSVHPMIQTIIRAAERVFSPGLIITALFLAMLFFAVVILNRIYTALFYPMEGYLYTREDEDRERALQNSVTYYMSPEPAGQAARPGSGTPGSAPPGSSASPSGQFGGGATGNGIFSPQENRMYGQQRMFAAQSSAEENGGGIYQTRSPITPSGSGGSSAGATGTSPAPLRPTTPYNLRRRY